jgi:uncharacterized protein (DUF433 family)
MLYVTDRITIDPDLCNGRPTIRGLRITVQTVLEFFFAGDSREEIIQQYPDLEPEDIDACLQFAIELMNKKYIIKPISNAA